MGTLSRICKREQLFFARFANVSSANRHPCFIAERFIHDELHDTLFIIV
jgi:hypothetical protein